MIFVFKGKRFVVNSLCCCCCCFLGNPFELSCKCFCLILFCNFFLTLNEEFHVIGVFLIIFHVLKHALNLLRHMEIMASICISAFYLSLCLLHVCVLSLCSGKNDDHKVFQLLWFPVCRWDIEMQVCLVNLQ